MSWAIKKVEGGHVITWSGVEWGMSPANRDWCQSYLARLEERYPEGGAWLIDGQDNTRTRGGPWRWTSGEQSEVIHTSRLEVAKGVLRHRLGRKALPKGITWNLELGS